jgi:hypothetical protein
MVVLTHCTHTQGSALGSGKLVSTALDTDVSFWGLSASACQGSAAPVMLTIPSVYTVANKQQTDLIRSVTIGDGI